jgi:hypothetical protein
MISEMFALRGLYKLAPTYGFLYRSKNLLCDFCLRGYSLSVTYLRDLGNSFSFLLSSSFSSSFFLFFSNLCLFSSFFFACALVAK